MRLLIILLTIFLVSCTTVVPYFKPEIQQGNLLNPALVEQLKPGMSQTDVMQLLGNPVLNNPYDNGRITYIYTDQKDSQPYVQHRLILSFNKAGKLTKASGDYPDIKIPRSLT